MKKIIVNKYKLTDNDVIEVVKRVKVLLINSCDEILLGYSYNTYQFPGGHVEEGESLIGAVNREVEEETGIILNAKGIEPFVEYIGYYKDYPELGKNRKIEIYYYIVRIDKEYNLSNTKYTQDEMDGNFELRYIRLDEVEDILKENVLKYSDSKGIANEMLEVFKIYKNNINRNR